MSKWSRKTALIVSLTTVILSCLKITMKFGRNPCILSIDWLIELGLTSPPTQYRLSGRRFYRSKTQPAISKYWRNNTFSHLVNTVMMVMNAESLLCLQDRAYTKSVWLILTLLPMTCFKSSMFVLSFFNKRMYDFMHLWDVAVTTETNKDEHFVQP